MLTKNSYNIDNIVINYINLDIILCINQIIEYNTILLMINHMYNNDKRNKHPEIVFY